MRSTTRTFTGILFDPINPNILHIEIEDIANGLVNNNRFCGQSSQPIPIAAHAIVVGDVLEAIGCSAAIVHSGHNHDDSEAYLLDIPAPVKHQPDMNAYVNIEHRLMLAISKRFDFLYPKPTEVHTWDTWVRRVEQGLYMRGHVSPEHIRDKAGNSIIVQGRRMVAHYIAEQLIEYIALPLAELKRRFIHRFYDLRTAACFAPPIEADGTVK